MSYREFYQHETLPEQVVTGTWKWGGPNAQVGDDTIMQGAREAYTRGLKEEQINHPSHYTRGQIECIEAIRAGLSLEEYMGYLKGSAIAYIWREKYKKGLDDVKKAQWFLDRLAQALGDREPIGLDNTGDTANPKTT